MTRKALIAGGIAVLATCGNAALAQSPTEDRGLEEVIVTAERRAESSQDVPTAMSVFSRDFIQEHIRDAFDLANFTPNLQLSEGDGFRQLAGATLRGIGLEERPSEVSSASILTYFDGLALGTPFGSGVPQWDLQRIEVQRGPQGTLYGRNALAGAMQYISADPTEELTGYGNLTFGQYHLRQFEGGVSGTVTETVKARLSGVVSDRAGNVTNVDMNARRLGAREYWGVRGIVDWEATEKLDTRIKVQHFEGQQDNTLLLNAMPSDRLSPALRARFLAEGTDADLNWRSDFYQVQSSLPDPYERFDFTLVELDLNYDFGPVKLTSVSGYMQGESTAFYDLRYRRPAVQVIALGADEPSGTDQWSEELRLTSQTEHPLQWIAGAYYQQNVDTLGTTGVSLGGLLPNGSTPGGIPPGTTLGSFASMGSFDHLKTYAVFMHTTYDWSDRLKTTQAVRYTKEERSADFGLSANFYYPVSFGALPGSIQAEGYDMLRFASLTHAERRAQAFQIISDPNTLDANGMPVPIHLADSWDKVTWRLAMDYHFADEAMLYGSVSTGFKGGTFARNSTGGSRAGVGPESSLVYELGAKTRWFDDRLQVNASVFYNDHTDLQANQQVLQTDPVTGALIGFTRIENLPKAELYGGELELRAVAFQNLILAANVGFLHTEITKALPGNASVEGKRLPFAADQNISGLIRYDFHTGLGTFSPQLSGRYIGNFWSIKDNNDITGELGDYWTTEARLSYTAPSGRVNAMFYMRNLSDIREVTFNLNAQPQNTIGTTSSRVNEGRNWGIRVGYRF